MTPSERRRYLLTGLGLALVLLVLLWLPSITTGGGLTSLRPPDWQLPGRGVTGVPLVAIQVGHLHAHEHAQELAGLRTSTGGYANGVAEVDVNQRVATRLAQALEELGVQAQVLPASVPPDYRAHAFISIHADSSLDPLRRGYKSAYFRSRRNHWDPVLKESLDLYYLGGSGLPDDHLNVSGAMLDYYAFDRRYRHSIHPSTPAVIVELGYLSNPRDLAFLRNEEQVAGLLVCGVVRYLATRGVPFELCEHGPSQ